MIKILLKLIGFTRINNPMTLFILLGMKTDAIPFPEYQNYSKNIITNKTDILFVISFVISFIFLILAAMNNNMGYFFFFIFIFTGTLISLTSINETNIIKNKLLKKEFKKDVKKNFNVDLKDKDFISFINAYYFLILKKSTSNKEAIKIINNWKKNENGLKKELYQLKISIKDSSIVKSKNIIEEELLKIKECKKDLKRLKKVK